MQNINNDGVNNPKCLKCRIDGVVFFAAPQTGRPGLHAMWSPVRVEKAKLQPVAANSRAPSPGYCSLARGGGNKE